MKANEVRMILAGMMAAGMALSAAPAMAEETEVQTEAAANYYAVISLLGNIGAGDTKESPALFSLTRICQ